MNGDLHDFSEPADPEDDRKLWELLAKAKRPEVSPYFARRVLREAALLPQSPPSSALWRGLKAWWQAGLPLLRPPRAAAWPGAFAALFICAASVMMTFTDDSSHLRLSPASDAWRSNSQEPASTPIAGQSESVYRADESAPGTLATGATDESLTQQDAEVIADLDSLMMREETHLWTDDNTAF